MDDGPDGACFFSMHWLPAPDDDGGYTWPASTSTDSNLCYSQHANKSSSSFSTHSHNPSTSNDLLGHRSLSINHRSHFRHCRFRGPTHHPRWRKQLADEEA